MEKPKQKVEVFIRIKPTDRFAHELVEISDDSKELIIHARETKKIGYINNQILEWKFSVDGVLHNDCQETVYRKCASRLVNHTLDGYNSTLFAYGQTGAGKTYTVTGTTNDFQHRGLIPRVLSHLYEEIKKRYEFDIKVRISYLEIYKEDLYDLLRTAEMSSQSSPLIISENEKGEAFVKGLSCQLAKTEEEALSLLFEGESNRVLGHHQLNRHSSRSHCIFTIHVESHCITDTQVNFTSSKFHLVDLAGSERIGKTHPHAHIQNEALHINKSLTFLEQTVIAQESRARCYVPYRQSKLTHILKDSIGGNCATIMVGNIWGEERHIEETLSTLRFASRAMNIACEPCVNSFINTDVLCKQYEREISLLKKELAMYDTLTNRGQINYEPLSDLQLKEIQMQVERYIENEAEQIEIINMRQIHEAFRQFKMLYKKKEEEWRKPVIEKLDTPSEKPPQNVDKMTNEVPIVFPDKSNLVGETDGSGFSVGRTNPNIRPAPSSAVVNIKKRNKKLRDVSEVAEKNVKANPASSTAIQNPSKSMQLDEKNSPMDAIGNSNQVDTTMLRIPLQKNEAFEIFKSDFGKELSTTFQENKGILRMKKCEAKSVSKSLNTIKKQMDEVQLKLEPFRLEKDNSFETEDDVYEQEEFELAQQLRMLKNEYRTNHELLQSLYSEIMYCEKLVKQCRHTIMIEFESWYQDTYSSASITKNDVNEKTVEESRVKLDAGELFLSKQKELLMKHPESYAFYNARFHVNRRRLYNERNRIEPILPKLKIANQTPMSI